ncbi:MAG: HAD family phosphatase [Clostridia bacterium]|nr:HAD family phosphatase [Clostridia bacterium]
MSNKDYNATVKNYIFDFGNVIAQFYPEKLTAPYVSDEKTKNYIADIVFDRLYWDKLDWGTITDDEVKESIRNRVPDELKDIACTVYDNWVNNLIPVQGMEKLIQDIHKSGKKMYLLSNISKGFEEGYSNVEWINNLFGCFDGLVLSGPIGIAKPCVDVFEYLLKKYGLNREECLFIDDNEMNIEGAKKANIKGYLFDGDAEKLREYIEL